MTVLGQHLISAVRARAAENPDYIYKSPFGHGTCAYVHDGCPSCLIGQALWDLGLIDASFAGTSGNYLPFFSVVDHLGLVLDPEERKWLREVQYYQDTQRYSWGESVANADSFMLDNFPKWNVA